MPPRPRSDGPPQAPGEPGVCPICGKPTANCDRALPFCSKRCKLIDLGRWLSGRYAIEWTPEAPEGDAAAEEFPEDPPDPEGTR